MLKKQVVQMVYLLICSRLQQRVLYTHKQNFSLSLSAGKFPALWKSPHVVPVPKSVNKVDASNYRPISLLSIVGKLLEKYVYSLLWNHLEEHAPLLTNQCGFQAGKSSVTALLMATSEWQRVLDLQGSVMCIFFYLKKAFDTVPH